MREDLPGADEVGLAVAAFRIGQPYAIAYRMLLGGELTGRRVGRSWFVNGSDVVRLEAEMASGRVVQPA